jgi:hypothetical protein
MSFICQINNNYFQKVNDSGKIASAVASTFSECFVCCILYLIAILVHVLNVTDTSDLFMLIAQLYFSAQLATLGSRLNYLVNNVLKSWRYYE